MFVVSNRLTDPLGPGPNGLRARPHAMFPFYVLVIRTNDDSGLIPILNPIHDTQYDAVVCLVGSVGTPTPTKASTLTDLPRSWPPEAVPHSGYHEQSPK